MTERPVNLEVRLMNAIDIDHGFLDTVSALSPVTLTREQAIAIFQKRLRLKVQTYVALIDHHVVGTASLLIEPKFIHDGGIVGHIEDVAVANREQHHGIGHALMEHLLDVCQNAGCYKVILDCAPHIAEFYARMGFHEWAKAMRIDLSPSRS